MLAFVCKLFYLRRKFRYHVSDEMAFPLLLRGLSPTSQWVDLERAEVPRAEEAARPPSVLNPQDLLLVGEKEWGEFHPREKMQLCV